MHGTSVNHLATSWWARHPLVNPVMVHGEVKVGLERAHSPCVTLHLRAPVQTPCTWVQEGARAQASEEARVQRICKDRLSLYRCCLAGFHWAQGHSLGLGLTYPHWRRCLPSGSERMDGAELRTGLLTATISSCATIPRDRKASFAVAHAREEQTLGLKLWYEVVSRPPGRTDRSVISHHTCSKTVISDSH